MTHRLKARDPVTSRPASDMRIAMWLNAPRVGLMWMCLVATSCSAGEDRHASVAEDHVRAEAAREWIVGGIDERAGVVIQGQPRAGAIGPDGSVLVAASVGDRQLVLIDSSGVTASPLGREGQGPSEFLRPQRIGVSGDTLFWVYDSGLERFTWMGLDGSVVTTERAPRLEGGEVWPWSVPASWILSESSVLGLGRSSGDATGPDGGPLPRPLVLWNQPEAHNVVAWLEEPVHRNARVAMTSGLPFTVQQRFRAYPLVGVARDADWFFTLDRAPADQPPGRIVITRWDHRGEVLSELEVAYQPVPVGDEILATMRGIAEAFEEQLPPASGGVHADDIVDAYWVPEHLPPVREALADADGFWLLRDVSIPGRWERYDVNGTPIHAVALPGGFRALVAGEDWLVGWDLDSLGVASILRYRIAPYEGQAGEGR